MAIATTSRRALSIVNIVRPVLRSIDKLPPRARPGLLGLIIFMVLAMVVLWLVSDVTNATVVLGILGIGSAVVVITTTGRRAPLYVVILLAFCITAIILNGSGRSRPAEMVIDAERPVTPRVEAEAKNASAAPKAALDDSVTIAGNVRYRTTSAAVREALVYVEGYGSGAATTNARGYFEITVPRRVIKQRRDSVTLTIETPGTTTLFTALVDGRPYAITLEPPAAPAAALPASAAGRAALAFHRRSRRVPPAPSGAQEGFRARVVLDSVKTLHDGSASNTYWRFDVNVDAVHAITVRQRAYDRRPGKNLFYLGGEATVTVGPAPRLQVHIRGLRDAFIGVHQINGYASVPRDSLPPEHPIHLQLEVKHDDDPDKGQFIFYYTLVRRGTPMRTNAADGSS